ncbi:MAG: prolyl oligopeptidase family serine peptidase [Acidobacteriota bacterium]
MKHLSSTVASLLLACMAPAALAAAGAAQCPPPTPKKPATSTFFGVKVTEDYRWLENWADPAVRAWSEAQNACAAKFLDALPYRAEIQGRLDDLLGGASPSYFDLREVHGVLFAMKRQPPKQQPLLVTLKSLDDPAAKSVVDPNAIDPRGITAIDWYVPSPDAKLLAVSLSVGGSEDGTVHVYDAATGKEIYEPIPRVNEGTAGGGLAWNQDGSGFYYTRYPRGKERPPQDLDFYQEVYFHKLGTPTEKDVYAVGKGWPRIAEATLKSSEDGKYILATVANGDGGQFAFYLLGPSGGWKQVAAFADKITAAEFGPKDTLVLLSLKDSPMGKVLRLSCAEPVLAQAKVVVPESKAAVVESFTPVGDRLFVNEMLGGPSTIRVYDMEGKTLGEVAVPPVSAVGEMLAVGGELCFRDQSYVTPPAWYRYAPATGKVTETALRETSPADYSDTEVIRTDAVSKDGTHVPLTILMRKGTKLDGQNPALLTGYGGFGIAMTPRFSPLTRLWIEQGGVWAEGSMRGGGEFGEAWHEAGMLTKKQNVFDDFAACAEALIYQKYTSSQKLAIEGGSNGGLLMGAELTQHPGLFKAVVSFVGIYDMLRVELSPNGSFNVTEFGTVKNEADFKALYAYSPYYRVKDGTAYPACLFLTGANDPRVDPMQSRKMVARLQAANAAKTPILLRTSSKSGHGIDLSLSQRIGQETDVYAFLFHALGMAYQPPPGAKK